MSRLVKGNSVNLGSDRFVLYPLTVPCSAVVRGEKPPAEDMDARRARDIMREAESFRADVRAQALLQAVEIREKARKEGLSEGYSQGRSRAESECRDACDQFKQLIQSLDRGREELFQRHEQELIDLALEIASKVVADRIERDDEAFMRIFKKAVEDLSGQKVVRLLVSEHALEFVTVHADYLRAMIPDAEKLEISLLEGAPRGTLIVDTDGERIDASTDRQLEVIGQTLADIRNQPEE